MHGFFEISMCPKFCYGVFTLMKTLKKVMEAAIQYTSRDERTLRRWRAAGCNLSDKADLRKWMAKSVKGKGRARTMILRKSAGRNGQVTAVQSTNGEDGSELEGSPAALRR